MILVTRKTSATHVAKDFTKIDISEDLLLLFHNKAVEKWPKEFCLALYGQVQGKQIIVSDVFEPRYINDRYGWKLADKDAWKEIKTYAKERNSLFLGFMHSHPSFLGNFYPTQLILSGRDYFWMIRGRETLRGIVAITSNLQRSYTIFWTVNKPIPLLVNGKGYVVEIRSRKEDSEIIYW